MDKPLCDNFANSVNDLLDFISIFSITNSEDTVDTLETTRLELNSNWSQVRRAYIDCREHEAKEGEKVIDKNKLRKNYMEAMDAYKKALSAVNIQLQNVREKQMLEKTKRES